MAKGKGSGFEREICKKLSLWWSGGKTDAVFWRTAMSGGRATVRDRQGKATVGQYGDIQATHPKGQPLIDMFTIELKRGYNTTCILDMIDKPKRANAKSKRQFEQFYDQVKDDQRKSKSLSWLLIHKRDSKNIMVYTDFFFIYYLHKAVAMRLQMKPHIDCACNLDDGNRVELIGMELDSFLDTVKRRDIIKILKQEQHA